MPGRCLGVVLAEPPLADARQRLNRIACCVDDRHFPGRHPQRSPFPPEGAGHCSIRRDRSRPGFGGGSNFQTGWSHDVLAGEKAFPRYAGALPDCSRRDCAERGITRAPPRAGRRALAHHIAPIGFLFPTRPADPRGTPAKPVDRDARPMIPGSPRWARPTPLWRNW